MEATSLHTAELINCEAKTVDSLIETKPMRELFDAELLCVGGGQGEVVLG